MLIKVVKRLGAVLSGIEIIIAAALGTALFIGLFVVVPFSLARDLFASRPLVSVLVLVVSILALLTSVRDLLRRQWTIISVAVVTIWFLCVLIAAFVG